MNASTLSMSSGSMPGPTDDAAESSRGETRVIRGHARLLPAVDQTVYADGSQCLLIESEPPKGAARYQNSERPCDRGEADPKFAGVVEQGHGKTLRDEDGETERPKARHPICCQQESTLDSHPDDSESCQCVLDDVLITSHDPRPGCAYESLFDADQHTLTERSRARHHLPREHGTRLPRATRWHQPVARLVSF